MAWSNQFLDLLARDRVDLGVAVESVPVGTFTSGRELRLTTHPISGSGGGDWRVVVDPVRSSVSYGELQIPSWTRSATTYTLALTEDVRRDTTRGQLVIVRVGDPAWPIGEWAQVLVGVVRGIRWSAGRWLLTIVDAAYSLQSRPTSSAEDPRLFASLHGSSARTTITANYSLPGATISVSDTSGWQREDGEDYFLRITPSGGGAPYLMGATGKTGTSFTGLYGPLVGTVGADAFVGDYVDLVAILEGHPIDIVRRILVSTGNGPTSSAGNGAKDTLPAEWGYALTTDLVDGADCNAFDALTEPDTGVDTWTHVVEAAVDDGLAHLQELLRPGAFFLGIRQGQITVRGVCDPHKYEPPDVWSVSNADIESYETWDGVVEARALLIYPGSSSYTAGVAYGSPVSEDVDTRPSRLYYTIEAPSIHTNELEWAAKIDDRIRAYVLRSGERLTLRHPGFALAPATIGDVLELTTDQIESRYDVDGYGYSGRRTLVTGGGPDWFRGYTRLTIASHVPTARVSL